MTVDRALRLLGIGTGCDRAGRRRRRAARCAPTRSPRRWPRATARPTIVVAQAGNVNGGGDRSDRRGVRRRARRRRVGARRRRVRAVGGGQPVPPAPGARRRAGRLVGDRRAQVAQRPVRLRDRVRPRPRGAPRRDLRDRRVPRAGRRRPARADGLDARVLAPRPRPGGLRDAARARPRRASAELVDRLCACAERFADRLGDAGFEVLPQELNQVLVALRGRRARPTPRSPPSRPTARATRAGRPGAAGAASASRCATGRRRSTTSTARSTRWRPPFRPSADRAAPRSTVRCSRSRRPGTIGSAVSEARLEDRHEVACVTDGDPRRTRPTLGRSPPRQRP